MWAETFAGLSRYRIVPIATQGLNTSNADAVGDALVAGGLPLIEVTLRAPGAIEAVAKLAKRGDLIVSTGTVFTLDQAKASLDAGASYMVAPGLDMKLVEWAIDRNFPFIPGATTATEITQAYKAGLRVLKFFPAEAAGGVAAMELFAGPFTGLKFLPTGGINREMLKSYLTSRPVVAVGQGSLLKPESLRSADWEKVEADARSAVEHIRRTTLETVQK